MKIDENIKSAIDLWIEHGVKPGFCAESLLRGNYYTAYKHAQPFLELYWQDHIDYVKSLPENCRGKNFDTWKGLKRSV